MSHLQVNNSKFFLTDRDQRILLAIFKSKILSLEMIQERFFPGSSKSAACRRMRKLAKQGYITPKPTYVNSRQVATYMVKPNAITTIEEFLDYAVTHKYYVSDSIQHDLDLADIDLVLNRFIALRGVISESELQSCGDYQKNRDLVPFIRIRSDRVLSVESDSGLKFVALEYERSIKSQKRNALKFQDYYSKKRIPAVFYVCKDKSVTRALLKVDQELTTDRKSKIYFCTLDEFNSESDQITFQRHDGHKVNFKLNHS